jgi:hypothetical protein
MTLINQGGAQNCDSHFQNFEEKKISFEIRTCSTNVGRVTLTRRKEKEFGKAMITPLPHPTVVTFRNKCEILKTLE